MRKILTSTAFLTLFAALAFAESWSGTLIDASCYSQQKNTASCMATSSTTAFALNVAGQVLTMDDAGNTQTAAALKNRADRSTDQDGKSSPITAKVTGTRDGDTLKVDTIEVQ
jgi:endonuclease YncB( thermonuclease family)